MDYSKVENKLITTTAATKTFSLPLAYNDKKQ